MSPQYFLPSFKSIDFSVQEKFTTFSRWQAWRPSWISDKNDFSYFWSTSNLDTFYQMLSQLAFQFRRSSSIDLQNGAHGGHLGLSIGTILATCSFNLQDTLTLPTKFRINWPFCSGEEFQNRFLKWWRGGHLVFPIGTILAFLFNLKVTMILSTKFQVKWPFGSKEVQNRFW